MTIADTVREGGDVPHTVTDPAAAALQRDASAMIDIDYAGSPLVADRTEDSGAVGEPHPGQRYPDWTRLDGSTHHLLAFGRVDDTASLERLSRRWSGLVEVAHEPDLDPARAGLPSGGVVLIRPDGHIGFQSPFAGTNALDALDRHLSSYLVARSAAVG